MHVSSAVQWWDQSQLQVLVLASLAIQSFLAIFGARRNYHIPPWLRFFIWLSFLGSDAVAIYALATLFNRQKQVQQTSSAAHESHDLEVFWTPILLMHLGGQGSISAYNLEDNELWRRHIITSLSQITVATYVFWKSWSSSADKRLLAAAILICIAGTLKCLDKFMCLRSSSFSTRANLGNPLWTGIKSNTKEQELDKYIKKARAFIAQSIVSPNPSTETVTLCHSINVDVPRSYDTRLENLKTFWVLKHQVAYSSPKSGLNDIFYRFYTKSTGSVLAEYMGDSKYELIFRMSPMLLLTVATILFHTSNKQAYRARDTNVTFVLLYGTMLLELISNSSVMKSYGWHDMVAQHSLTEFVSYATKGTRLMRLAHSLKCWRLLLGYWCMEPCSSSESITSTVREYCKLWWEEFITDAEHYREVSRFRGQWTLERNGLVAQLGWSLEKPFDESVLLWHIATDLCFYTPSRLNLCKQISNYMSHLLLRKPDMLMTGSRKNLLTVAFDELSKIDHRTLCQDGALKVIEKMKIEDSPNGGFIHDAKLLAQHFRHMGIEKMWKVTEGVWIEMLCFAAGRCPGHLHIKSLGSGGEYLSSVWLTLEHAGLESLPERLTRGRYLDNLKTTCRITKEEDQILTLHPFLKMKAPFPFLSNRNKFIVYL